MTTQPEKVMENGHGSQKVARLPNKMKPVVVGIYGISGCGKTYLLNQLKATLDPDSFAYYDGSDIIARVTPGGLEAFRKLLDPDKATQRQLAINAIGNECTKSRRIGIVAGHFMFWNDDEKTTIPVYTPNDLNTFTHILYLNVPTETVAQRRQGDKNKYRPDLHVDSLRLWQETEIMESRKVCRNHGILFSLIDISPLALPSASVDKVSSLILDFQHHADPNHNLSFSKEEMKKWLGSASPGPLETVLALDGDKTLAPHDTGSLFWQSFKAMATTLKKTNSMLSHESECPLNTIFSGPLLYSETAFRQAVLIYEEATDDKEFDLICEKVASEVTMHPEFVSLLQRVAQTTHVRAVVMTCGLARVWNKVLRRNGLSESVKVIGGGRIVDGYVVTAEVKAALVTYIRSTHEKHVWAFGDSVLDLPMLKAAHRAVVVVGDKKSRSKSMEGALESALNDGSLRAHQLLLPEDVEPRLDQSKLPLLKLDHPEFLRAIFPRSGPAIVVATDRTSAKLLMAPMRDAKNSGPTLREAHRRVGWYLATEFISEIIGLEEYEIDHVQGGKTSGHRLRHEEQTTIVALMRGGEPMAFGVSDAFPLTWFVHTKKPEQLEAHHVMRQKTILLVDSVVNNGNSVLEFVEHIRKIDAYIRIVVVTGVVQAKSVSSEHGGAVAKLLEKDPNVNIVALRMSDNKYTGHKGTDTGHRLFNTTHLD